MRSTCVALTAEPNGNLAGVLLKVVEDTPKVYNLLVCTLCRWATYLGYAVVSITINSIKHCGR